MRGQILGVDVRTGEGQLSGDDGRRYRFQPEDWAHRGEPAIGLQVDFEPEDLRARSIFPLPGQHTALVAAPAGEVAGRRRRGDRNKFVAARLAFFLGWFGVHRCYLGRNGSGIAMLVLTLTAVGALVSVPWAFIDAVRLLIMSEREFDWRYDRDPGER